MKNMENKFGIFVQEGQIHTTSGMPKLLTLKPMIINEKISTKDL